MEAKNKKETRGTVLISPELCKGCAFCIEFCPTHVLEFSSDYNSKGYHFPILVDPDNCSGCDLCGLYCPDFAIFGVRFKDLEKLKEAAGDGRISKGATITKKENSKGGRIEG